MKTGVGVIGLGAMGKPMALNILKAKSSLTVFARKQAVQDALADAGATVVHSPAAVAQQSDIIITVLPDTSDVEEVLFGEEGVVTGLREDTIVIDMSTISPAASVDFAARLANAGCHLLDAPVSGGPSGAAAGTLSIMLGGAEEAFRRCVPLLQVLGASVVHTGSNGTGLRTKLANQIVGAITLLGVVEGLRFARVSGLDTETTFQVISKGAAGSWMFSNLGRLILDSDFSLGFSVRLQHKDVRLVREQMAPENGSDYPGTELVFSLFTEPLERGLGEQGNQALFHVAEE